MVVTSSSCVRQAGLGKTSWEGRTYDEYRVGANNKKARVGARLHTSLRTQLPRASTTVLCRVVPKPSSYKPIRGRRGRGGAGLLFSGVRHRDDDATAQHSSETVLGIREGDVAIPVKGIIREMG